jgi:hypothetical protein
VAPEQKLAGQLSRRALSTAAAFFAPPHFSTFFYRWCMIYTTAAQLWPLWRQLSQASPLMGVSAS